MTSRSQPAAPGLYARPEEAPREYAGWLVETVVADDESNAGAEKKKDKSLAVRYTFGRQIVLSACSGRLHLIYTRRCKRLGEQMTDEMCGLCIRFFQYGNVWG
jgi:hypothetical protein